MRLRFETSRVTSDPMDNSTTTGENKVPYASDLRVICVILRTFVPQKTGDTVDTGNKTTLIIINKNMTKFQ